MTIIWGVYVLLVSVIAVDLYWPSCCGELIITGHLKEGGDLWVYSHSFQEEEGVVMWILDSHSSQEAVYN